MLPARRQAHHEGRSSSSARRGEDAARIPQDQDRRHPGQPVSDRRLARRGPAHRERLAQLRQVQDRVQGADRTGTARPAPKSAGTCRPKRPDRICRCIDSERTDARLCAVTRRSALDGRRADDRACAADARRAELVLSGAMNGDGSQRQGSAQSAADVSRSAARMRRATRRRRSTCATRAASGSSPAGARRRGCAITEPQLRARGRARPRMR